MGSCPATARPGVVEFLGLVYHGYRVTHLDALSHIFWDSKMYNDVPAELVTSSFGATEHAVTNVRGGIVTRGVLIDVPKHRDVPWLEPGEYVTPDEIDDILTAAGTVVGEGDAVLLRTGYGRRRLEQGPDRVLEVGRAGWQASCLPWFHDQGVSFIAADTAQDVVPSGYDNVRIPIHAVGITAMGLWLLDNCNLEPLARRAPSSAPTSSRSSSPPCRSSAPPVHPSTRSPSSDPAGPSGPASWLTGAPSAAHTGLGASHHWRKRGPR